MSTPADDGDLTRLSDTALDALVQELGEKERHVSAVRRRLHSRLEYVRGTGLGDAGRGELERLVAEEHELSRTRLELHRALDAALAEQHARRVGRNGAETDDGPPPPYRNRYRDRTTVPQL